MRRVLVILVAGIASAQVAFAATTSNVCDVAEHWREVDGKTVVIEAFVRAGTHYEMFLASPDCDRLLELDIPNRLDKSANVEKLRHLVFAGFPKSIPKPQARATFVGTLHVAKTSPHFMTLRVRKVAAVAGLPAN